MPAHTSTARPTHTTARTMSSNAQYVTRLLNREINNELGIGSGERGEMSSVQAERALNSTHSETVCATGSSMRSTEEAMSSSVW